MRIRRPCPICQTPAIENWTWVGVLEAIVCFPCGLCFARKVLHCSKCNVDVIVSDGTIPILVKTYKYYKEYESKDHIVPQSPLASVSPSKSAQTRMTSGSVSSRV
ncbi:unnamed protein product [Bursaphelenchus okinawaensis]|uniref:Brain protein I3 n=1 Tax=Bursaphelenchus okinawaensis TaxID=465554 RepID=A0A811K6L4_9BILA|nr:unnamed protein product [Bursaphelenchus okinawaensis]CAG9092505.1 unnamed protein product [Bursaphelenchus okinawaensis]